VGVIMGLRSPPETGGRGSANTPDAKPVSPFLKWAGGKRWFLHLVRGLVPRDHRRYFEPFLGSGSVFFALRPRNAYLSDSNGELIATFRQVRDHPEEVIEVLEQLAYDEDLYYGLRSAALQTEAQRAARVIYLNRCCWNGLYRVNRLGQFNVPFGSRDTPPVICDSELIRRASAALRDVGLRTLDFETALHRVGSGDFVFADPPYTVTHGNNGFVKYNERIFSWEDQERLRSSLLGIHRRGGLFFLTNADHPSIRRLYAGFCVRRLQRHSIIAGDSNFRRPVSELVVTNYHY
jgi:DNA adenine methylase